MSTYSVHVQSAQLIKKEEAEWPRGPGFKSRSDHLDLFHSSPIFKSKAMFFL